MRPQCPRPACYRSGIRRHNGCHGFRDRAKPERRTGKHQRDYPEDLQRKPVQNLKDVLRDVPGVQLTSEGDNRKGVSIRGLDSSYTLI